jgi:hypothetical protein
MLAGRINYFRKLMDLRNKAELRADFEIRRIMKISEFVQAHHDPASISIKELERITAETLVEYADEILSTAE